MRFIGRRLRLASPTNRAENGCAATTPAMRRVVVPLLPQSRALRGWRSPRNPKPLIRITWANGGICTPSSRNTVAVERMSSASRMPRISDSPSASEERISERWEIDLSPGTRMVPDTVNGAKTRAQ